MKIINQGPTIIFPDLEMQLGEPFGVFSLSVAASTRQQSHKPRTSRSWFRSNKIASDCWPRP